MTMNWKIVSGSVWDQTVAGFSGICQEQLFAFGKVRWPDAELEPILFSEAGTAIGGALVVIQRLPLHLGAIAVIKWGPVLARSDSSKRAFYDEIIGVLKHEYGQKRGMTVSIQPHVSTHAENDLLGSLAAHGFTPLTDLRPTERYLASLRHSDEELRGNFLPRWRRMLNKADRAKLSFIRADADRLPEFDALFQELHTRKGFSDHSAYDTVPGLLRHDIDAARYELFFATHEGVPVAGAIVFKAGDTAEYLYGATSAAGLALNAGFFLQFNTLLWLRDNTTARWYNLGGTDGSAGLLTFKSGLIGSLGIVRPLPPPMLYAASLRAKLTGQTAFFSRAWISHIKRQIGDWRDDRKAPQVQ